MSNDDLIARMEEEAAFRESIVRAQAETITARFRVGDLTREIARLSAELMERDAEIERLRNDLNRSRDAINEYACAEDSLIEEEREACAIMADAHGYPELRDAIRARTTGKGDGT